MNAMIEDPLPQCDELACDKCEGYRLSLSAALAQVANLEAELSATKCRRPGCGKSLIDTRPVDDGHRKWCGINCFIEDVKDRNRDLEW